MITIIDYGLGNLGSIANMLKKLDIPAVVSADLDVIGRADKLILPGVGAFDQGMSNLDSRGLVPLLNKKVQEDGTPILGLCLGMHLFTKMSEEGGRPGLGWLDAKTVAFDTDGHKEMKVPHMGWNHVRPEIQSPLWRGLDDNRTRFYFVHSYHVVCNDDSNILATTEYGYRFVSALVNGNIIGTQFHPEKSHKFGMRLLRNFAENF